MYTHPHIDENENFILKKFISRKIKDILDFYSYFRGADDLIVWMQNLPKPNVEIFEYNISSDLSVIIPTADKDGVMAKRCIEDVFNGCHIIMVESGKDGYFNLAYSYNMGLKRALDYDREWIMISNDDMRKIDQFSDLEKGLKRLNSSTDALILPDSKSLWRDALIGEFPIFIEKLLSMKNKYEKIRHRLEKKFAVKYKYYRYGERNTLKKLFREKYLFPNIADFGIFSGLFVKKCNGMIFDEVFLSGVEDLDISLRLKLSNIVPKYINYKIEGIGKLSQGSGYDRWLRDVANFSYLNRKINNGFMSGFTDFRYDCFRNDTF